MKYILVDTCIWVDFFKGTDNNLCDSVANLISEDRILLSDVVRSELLVGARDQKELEELGSILGGLKIAKIDSEIFMKAGELGFLMRRSGVTLPLTDLVIAAQAIFYEIQIWTYDKHFSVIDKELNINLICKK